MDPGSGRGLRLYGEGVMSATQSATMSGGSPTTVGPKAYLIGPVLDFLLLGGGSLIALLLIRLLLGGTESAQVTSLAATLALANIINHPHFAHSYQIFYSGFGRKLGSEAYPLNLRVRYLLMGVIAPLAMISYFAWTIWAGLPRLLGVAANAMFFLVGWHYVKQGYGMAMVDAVLKRAFYSEREKRVLLINAYATWIFSWIFINHLLGSGTKQYFEIDYFVIPIPTALLLTSLVTMALTTVAAVIEIAKRARPVAWNGLIAYAISIYAWLLIRDPVLILWIPLFHSLQYMAVVWRFQINKCRQTRSQVFGHELGHRTRLLVFGAASLILGYAGFWLVPEWLNSRVPYDKTVFGGSLFFFVSWIFINIHHYCLDTVMWRKGNPDVAAYLFSTGSSRG